MSSEDYLKFIDNKPIGNVSEAQKINENYKEQIIMVRNFPHHVGDYDSKLPEEWCEHDQHGQGCFRAGWSCAISAINKKITQMQKEINIPQE